MTTQRIITSLFIALASLSLSACGEEKEEKPWDPNPTYSKIWKGLNKVKIEVPVFDAFGEKTGARMMTVKSIQLLRSSNSQDFSVIFVGIGDDKHRLTIPARANLSFLPGCLRIEGDPVCHKWQGNPNLEILLQEGLADLRREAGDI
jgi:hypothetical protein